jgi:hypothetical protein
LLNGCKQCFSSEFDQHIPLGFQDGFAESFSTWNQIPSRTGVVSVENIDYFEKFTQRSKLTARDLVSDFPITIKFIPFWPAGWWDDNKIRMANFLFEKLRTVDPKSRQIFPQVDLDLRHHFQQISSGWLANAPWNFWFTMMSPPLDAETQKFAVTQVRIDEARIACGLERYRLVHHVYPASLESLVPEFIDELPHDMMNGNPYHYRLNNNGTFLLYSVGWNQTDDDGKVVFKKDAPKEIDYEQGDWVWPTPQAGNW